MPWPEKEWLTLSEVAQILGVHPSTVRIWANKGKIPVHRTGGGHRRFRRSELEMWMRSREAKEDVAIPRELIQNVLHRVRRLAEGGVLAEQPWYRKLTPDAIAHYREAGYALTQHLWAYLVSDDAKAAEEAAALGYENAARARQAGLSMCDALLSFLFFSQIVMEAVLDLMENAEGQSPKVWASLMRRIKTFSSQVAISTLETYQAYERGMPSP